MGFVKEVLMDWLDAYAFHNAGIHSQDKNYAREVFPDEKLNIQAKTNIPEGDTVQTQIVIHTNTSTTPIVVDEEEYVENTEVNRTLTVEEIAKGQGLKLESILAISANFEHDGKKQQTNKVKIAPLISEAYFAVEEDGKEQAYPDMAELKTIYIANGGKDGSKDTRDANGTVKGEVTFHYAVAGDTFKGVSDKYKIEGDVNKGKSKLFDLSKTRDLPKEKQFIIANTPELYFYVKQPKRPKVYKQIDKVSLSQEVFLVIKSKQKLGSKVKVEIVEDGTYINTTKDTPVGFQEITGTADKPIKTEKKLYEVELTKVDDKGLNEGAIKIELAPKSEITLNDIQAKFAPPKPKEIEKAKVFTPNFTPITEVEKLTANKADSKIFSMGASSKGLSHMASSVGIIGGYKNLKLMNGVSSNDVNVGDVFYYREDSKNTTKNAFDKLEKARIDKLKEVQEEKFAKEKEKTTNLFIRGKDGENISDSKCLFKANEARIVINVKRIKQWAKGENATHNNELDSNAIQGGTISELEVTVDGKVKLTKRFILEAAGPSSQIAGKDDRIFAGKYYIIDNPGDNKKAFRLVQIDKNKVKDTFGIKDSTKKNGRCYVNIHVGNKPKNLVGCLCPGTEKIDMGKYPMVSNSVRAFGEVSEIIKKSKTNKNTNTYDGMYSSEKNCYQNHVFYEEVIVIIKDEIK